jgi:hypothetical protein
MRSRVQGSFNPRASLEPACTAVADVDRVVQRAVDDQAGPRRKSAALPVVCLRRRWARVPEGGLRDTALVSNHPDYPFIPQTTTHLRPGDYWPIPLRRGGWYACGRVLRVLEGRVLVVVGLMDWCEPTLPTAASLQGRRILKFGTAHVRSIAETGGPILGNAPLEDEADWDAQLPRPGEPPRVGDITFGGEGLESSAHEFFGRHFPNHPVSAAERPAPLQSDYRGL